MRGTLVMAIHDEESEPALVELDEHQATITLDDGAAWTFDLAQLREAVWHEEPSVRLVHHSGGEISLRLSVDADAAGNAMAALGDLGWTVKATPA